MEHEVFVPVAAERLKEALADPTRVARAVPGLQQDAGAEPVAGRLKVRVGNHSITYRGTLRLTPGGDGGYAVEGDAAETRGTGTAKLALSVSVRPASGPEAGSTLTFTGTATADGRITELPRETVASSLTRLLTRFAENLGEGERERAAAAEPAEEEPASGPDAPAPSVFDAEIPPPALAGDLDEDDDGDLDLDADADDGLVDDIIDVDDASVLDDDLDDVDDLDDEPPAEAAHARRTMIGRSAEEVDHAPPRGRYAPVPAPQTVVPGTTLRWAAPAAALIVASAILVGRALRRRR
ncbi:SRPBCC domain-containing protein [Streptomyces sp. NPDC006610]|uniref:SRPBCC domain-containing protein n=1 Tax=Streptomyces sp. NPDC006610 TaxID=3154584 RepID=UPI0033B1A47B